MTNPRDDLMAPEIDLHTYCGADARRWAEAFSQIKARQGWSVDDIDTDLMIGWFANAIEVACAIRLAASRPAPVDREAVARALCESGKFETGEGTCSLLCMDQLGSVRKKGCNHLTRVHGKLVDSILSLLRPAEPVEAKWRPIETAPKEDPERPGRDFEIIVGGGEIKDESADLLPWRPFDSWSLACYDSMRGCWRGEQTEQYDCFYLHKPTHWMPKFAGPGQCGSTTPDAVSEPVEAEGVREPVAWIITWSDGETSFTRSAPSASSPKNCKYQPLYTHPQKSPDTSAAVLQEALLDATASLVAAASAYRKYASRHRRVGRAAADPFFCTRVHDFEKAAESAQAAIRQLPTTERGDK